MDYEYILVRKISDFFQNLQKFEICKSYILLISWSENIFKGIFLLRGSRRMGKSCQHILLYFFKSKFAFLLGIFESFSKIIVCACWAYAEPNFFWEISKKFLFQNLHYGPIRWVPRRFFQILIFYNRNLHFN